MSTPSHPVRLSVTITPEVAEAIRELAQQRGITVSELVRDALDLERYFAKWQAKGETIVLRSSDGTTREVTFR